MALVYGSPEYLALVEQYGAVDDGAPLSASESEALTRYYQRQEGTTDTGGGFWSFDWLGGAVKGGLSAYGRILQIQQQKEMFEANQQLAQARMNAAMFGPSQTSVGGINVLTIVALGGVGLLAFFMLTERRK